MSYSWTHYSAVAYQLQNEFKRASLTNEKQKHLKNVLKYVRIAESNQDVY
jgi:hypothetical protein